ncbi:hypothetical protein VB620_05330 [Nodularia harveyana UHCC-0300]|uniref:Type II secretion system protein GspE N-terminal domain-containing protein n=1 Tax=Nodularia harveyana UHCC-0300 TaxID=2974287 RepID=A0ABU5UB61_9CYAN|nr:hypothetical protein [Nodularia harveyana]MEA5580762.1 hypothetical protein [Nodularia harveyana UHCC-0300]
MLSNQFYKLGELLLRQGLISETDLKSILEEQKDNGCLLGELMLKNRLVTEKQLKKALNNQKIRLGTLLVKKRLISQEILHSFLTAQIKKQQPLGKLLVQANCISVEQLELVLQEQFWRRNGFWVID